MGAIYFDCRFRCIHISDTPEVYVYIHTNRKTTQNLTRYNSVNMLGVWRFIFQWNTINRYFASTSVWASLSEPHTSESNGEFFIYTLWSSTYGIRHCERHLSSELLELFTSMQVWCHALLLPVIEYAWSSIKSLIIVWDSTESQETSIESDRDSVYLPNTLNTVLLCCVFVLWIITLTVYKEHIKTYWK